MRTAASVILVMISAFMVTVTLLPCAVTADTGAAVVEAGVNHGDTAIASIQKWIDFAALNSDKLFSLCGAIVVGGFGLALLIRAQLRLWRADTAGVAVTEAVERSGSAPAVRAIMDAATPSIKKYVRGWLKK